MGSDCICKAALRAALKLSNRALASPATVLLDRIAIGLLALECLTCKDGFAHCEVQHRNDIWMTEL